MKATSKACLFIGLCTIEKWTEEYLLLISALADSEAVKLVTQRGFGITVLGDFQNMAKKRHIAES